ncbi:MAG TPA: hypothetical protein VHF50_07005 [Solirubrobacterales bacterium]|nr:hypothetical protein [Solirubrobacterales bacterium]
MALIDALAAREYLEGIVAAFSVLGGAMAYSSGFGAARALLIGSPPEVLAHQVNEGIAWGFLYGSSLATLALIIMVWT